MNYTFLTSEYTPNNHALDIMLDNDNTPVYALHIGKYELRQGNKILPTMNQPQAEIIFSYALEFILNADALKIEDLNEWKYDFDLYTDAEFTKKMNGYLAEPLNKSITRSPYSRS